jgi:hypothetical protein
VWLPPGASLYWKQALDANVHIHDGDGEEPATYYVPDHYLIHPVVLVRVSRIKVDQLQDLLRSAKRGGGRVCLVIACYRMAHDGWTNEQAFQEASALGHGPNPDASRAASDTGPRFGDD